MSEVTISTEPAEDSAGVAAGVALATAGDAHEDAQEAVAVAEQAEQAAGEAVAASAVAVEEAFNARAAVDAVNARLDGLREELLAAVRPAEPEPVVEEPVVPAPEPTTAKPEPEPVGDDDQADDKDQRPRRREHTGYGNARWFGGRS